MFTQPALPDPLTCADGTVVADPETWRSRRRPELLELFATQVYGMTPSARLDVETDIVAEHDDAVDGIARLRDVRIRFGVAPHERSLQLRMFVPKARRAAPAFLGLNFAGNEAVASGSEASRWPVATIIARGYALVTACYEDIEPDRSDGLAESVRPLFASSGEPLAPDAWGAIGAWAWGLSRALDYLATDGDVDARNVAVVGHSRLGKAALWAAAQDERLALAIVNDSGRGGAAVARRRAGESITQINTTFPHWFCGNFKRYNDREDALPVDQHELTALVAPRPVLVCSAEDDAWADPLGEFLGALGADAVYRLLGTDGLAVAQMPPVGTPILSTIGYHVRPGGHDVTAVDWAVFLDFADRHLGRRFSA